MSKLVLITGGAGFLGSHLCRRYLGLGYGVVAVDNLSTGRQENLSELIEDKNFIFIKADITEELPQILNKMKFDLILNMASPASPPQYQRLNIETLMVGSLGTFNILELARNNNSRIFHASTSEVYGDPEVHPQTEDYKGSVNCYGPRAMYDESKRFSEAMIYAHKERYDTNTCIGRFFNTYGPNMDPNDGRVVSNLIVQALKNKPLTVHGKGNQTRSFCYVDDLIDGIVLLVDSNVSEPINLGNPGEFTILQLAKLVQKMTKSKSKIVYKPLPGDDPMQRKPDISKAKRLLNWEPSIPLDKGLAETIDYFSRVI